MAVLKVDDFLAVLERSKLLTAEQLAEVRDQASGAADSTAVAKSLIQRNLVSRWQAAQLLAGRASFFLGKYKLIQLLGRGGMGSVFLAEHVTMNRRVALKIVPREVGSDRASLERFFAEARAIAALDHTNIVQAYSVDNECERYFIVMEYVDGLDLQRMVEREGRLDFDRAADYIRQAAEGLGHAHARNMVHCDVKPSNLLVNPQGVVKILDMGLSRLRDRMSEATARPEEAALGTVDYLAPEQALETPDFDHRADIYSLGCTFYFLLTGHPPFPEGTLAQRIVKHQTQQPRPIADERPDTPPELIEICQRMMAKRPEDRYESAEEVARLLLAWRPTAHDSAVGKRLMVAAPLDEELVADGEGGLSGDNGELSIEGESAGGGETGDQRAAEGAGAKAWGNPVTPSDEATAPPRGRSRSREVKLVAEASAKPRTAGFVATLAAAAREKLPWFNTPRRKIVGALVAGAVLLAALLAAAIPLLRKGSATPAEAEIARASSEAAKTEAGDGAETPDKKTTEAGVGENAPDGEAKKKPDEPEEDDSDRPKKTKKKPKSDEQEESTEAKTAEGTAAEKSSKQPAEEAKPQTEEKPEAKAQVKPEAKPEAKPEQKPEPEKKSDRKTKPTPREAPRKVASLDALQAAIDLPTLGKDSEEPVSLGRLDLESDAALDMKLLGGDLLGKGNAKFELDHVTEGDAPGWYIQVDKGKDPEKIARVWRNQNELTFQWLPDAKDRAYNGLRNCGLLISCEGQQRFVALSKPKQVDALPVNLDQGTAQTRFTGDCLPDASLLRLQVTPLDRVFPKYEIKVLEPKARDSKGGRDSKHGKGKQPQQPDFTPGDTISTKGHMAIVLVKEKTPPAGFQVNFDAKGQNVTVSMNAVCEVSGQELPFSMQSLRGAMMYLQSADTQPKRSSGGKSGKRSAPQPKAPQMDTRAMRDQVTALSTLMGELNKKTKINFRVFVPLGRSSDPNPCEVTLFQSGVGEAPRLPADDRPEDKKGARGGRR